MNWNIAFQWYCQKYSYNDKLTLDLGNIKMDLFWFGKCR